VTYLELIEAAHARYVGMSPQALRAVHVPEKDRLSAWVIEYLIDNPGADLNATLQAAMQRRYSASPYQTFLTGKRCAEVLEFRPERQRPDSHGGARTANSVNLVFVRLMREITDHLTYRAPSVAAALFDDPSHPERSNYLARFADTEGKQFVYRFYRKYSGQSRDAAPRTGVGRRSAGTAQSGDDRAFHTSGRAAASACGISRGARAPGAADDREGCVRVV